MYSKIKNALFSTAYLPPVEYFVYMLVSENVWVESYETYPKQTYRNRCYIYGANGVESLHIPVIKPYGNRSKTGEVYISYDRPWQRNHWRAICTAYRKTPYFIYYQDSLEMFYQKKIDKLTDFNLSLLKTLFTEIGIKKTVRYTTCFEKEGEGFADFRTIMSPKSNDDLTLPYYDQVFSHKHGFVPNLSIIDLLFHKGPDTIDYLVESSNNIGINYQGDKQS